MRERHLRSASWALTLIVSLVVWVAGLRRLEVLLRSMEGWGWPPPPPWLASVMQFLWLALCLLLPAYGIRWLLAARYPDSRPRSADWQVANPSTGRGGRRR